MIQTCYVGIDVLNADSIIITLLVFYLPILSFVKEAPQSGLKLQQVTGQVYAIVGSLKNRTAHGGAVRGVLCPLIVQGAEQITIANRTLSRAEQLVEQFSDPTGHDTELQSIEYEALDQPDFNLIINATSAGLNDHIPPIPDSILGINTICYDMMYNLKQPSAFVKWAQQHGALRAYDDLGMLVEQAAESFYIWRGTRPQTGAVI